ncbi:MAG: hypothetical protein ACOYN8_12630 [Pseudanabaena sp.]|jgi:hypothetical protein
MDIPSNLGTIYADEINAANGRTVDGEGLLNNYAIEPEMYEEDGKSLSELTNRVTVVDIFPSEAEAKSAVLEMEHKGLKTAHISIIAKDYQDSESMDWNQINAEGGLAVVLKRLGISDDATSRFMDAVADGKFLVIEIGSDRDASQVQHILEKVGHTAQAS